MKFLLICTPFQSLSRPTASLLSTSSSRAVSREGEGSLFYLGVKQVARAGELRNKHFGFQSCLTSSLIGTDSHIVPVHAMMAYGRQSSASRPGHFILRKQPPYGMRRSLLQDAQTGSGANPASAQWVTVALSLRMKRLGRAADHSPPPSAEIKNEHRYTSNPSTCLHGGYRNTFTI
jgi:hypothetical protein